MNFKEHSNAGIVVSVPVIGLSYYIFQDIRTSLTMGICCFAGSLIPDLDTGSTPSRITAIALLVWSLAAYSVYKFGVQIPQRWVFNIELCFWANLIYIAFKASKHRGISHKYILPVTFAFIAFYTGYLWFTAIAIGIIVHLFVDRIYPWNYRSLV